MSQSFENISSGIFKLQPHMRPLVRISPFTPQRWQEILQDRSHKLSSITQEPSFWLDGGRHLEYCNSGRAALSLCLEHFKIKKEDEVLIVKNTDGPYISSCVTKTIEKHCGWSQTFSVRTRVIFVIHEFGFPCPPERFLIYQKKGIPIVEDCAYALGSRIEGESIGRFGDFAIYSLPKYYPIPLGGILVFKKKTKVVKSNLICGADIRELIKQTIGHPQRFLKTWNNIRRENWNFFVKRVLGKGLTPYFMLTKYVVPGVCIVGVPQNFEGEETKQRLNAAGVESTQYYHQKGFYFPVHQFLTDYEKEYILFHFFSK